MRRQEIEAIVRAYNNLVDQDEVKINLFGEDILWRCISEEDYALLGVLLDGIKRVEYKIGGLVLESEEYMNPTIIKEEGKVYIRTMYLNDLHYIIERLMYSYKKIRFDELKVRKDD